MRLGAVNRYLSLKLSEFSCSGMVLFIIPDNFPNQLWLLYLQTCLVLCVENRSLDKWNVTVHLVSSCQIFLLFGSSECLLGFVLDYTSVVLNTYYLAFLYFNFSYLISRTKWYCCFVLFLLSLVLLSHSVILFLCKVSLFRTCSGPELMQLPLSFWGRSVLGPVLDQTKV